MEISLVRPLSAVTAGTLAVALVAGCSSESQAPETAPPTSTGTVGPDGTPEPSASDEPSDSSDPEADARAIAVDYLEKIAAGDDAGAFALLSPESQAWYTDVNGFATMRGADGSITPEDADEVLGGTVLTTEGPEGGFYVVTASAGAVAGAVVVRDEDDGMVIDDPGTPLNGPSGWEWDNPPVGPDDSRVPASYVDAEAPTVLFTTVEDSGGEVVEPPTSAFGVVNGEEVPVVVGTDEGDGARAAVGGPSPAIGQVVTIVWQAAPTSSMWRTSTVTLTSWRTRQTGGHR